MGISRDTSRELWTGDLKRYVERALEMEHLPLCRGSIRGTWGGVSFLVTLTFT
jgi:hypothetical protein